MNEQAKTHPELIEELSALKRRIKELEQAKAKRKQAEDVPQRPEENFRGLAENINDIFYELDGQGMMRYVSPSVERIFGYTQSEVIGRSLTYFLDPADTASAVRNIQNVLVGHIGLREYRVRCKSGDIRWIGAFSIPIRKGDQVVGIRGILSDITERKRTQEALRESEARYRLLAENATDVIWVVGMDMQLTYISPSVTKLLGFTVEEAMARTMEQAYTPASFAKAMQIFAEEMTIESGGYGDPSRSRMLELELVHKNGNTVPVEGNFCFLRDPTGEVVGILSIVRDITDRRQVEEALRESEALFSNYLENAPDGVYMNDMKGNFLYGNRKSEEIIGYRRDELIGKNFLELNILSENSLPKAARLLQATIEGKSTGPDEIELISKDGRIIPIEITTSVVQRMGQRIVLAFARDITERKEAEKKLQDTLDTLRKALNTTIQVMVSAIEIRDPYTANHQIRSADLARAIATEMGFTKDRIDAIRMAGAIHDIGKLSIPAEILSKPTRLTEMEFCLIKEHSRQGYELLKDVESAWPLAEIVYQHHERIDGSGYPRHLKKDEILMEARILAIADTVESMASHRPYRPALGIEAALKEIENNRGILFDITAADACLTLFREKGFKFKGT